MPTDGMSDVAATAIDSTKRRIGSLLIRERIANDQPAKKARCGSILSRLNVVENSSN
jgi:hypothetical protein